MIHMSGIRIPIRSEYKFCSHVTPYRYLAVNYSGQPRICFINQMQSSTPVSRLIHSFGVLSTLIFNFTKKNMDDHYQRKSVREQAWMDWDFI